MIFTRKKRTPTDLKFGRTAIEEVLQIKYLGIVFDNKLTWESHIHQLCSKVSKGSWALLKLRKYVDIKTLLSVYYSLVHSHLQYCITAWGSATANALDLLVKMRKRVVRIMTFSHFQEHSLPLFYKLKI